MKVKFVSKSGSIGCIGTFNTVHPKTLGHLVKSFGLDRTMKVETLLQDEGQYGIKMFVSDIDFPSPTKVCPGLGGWKRVDCGWITYIR